MRLFVLTACCCAALSTSAQAVKINEIRIDQPSNDDDEYVELLGFPGEALDGLTYVILGDGSQGSGEVEQALDLTGQVVGASGFFLVAEDADTFGATADLVENLEFENSDNVTHLLVTGFGGAMADDLDINDDGILDTLPWTGVVDGLAVVEDLAAAPGGTEFHYGDQLGLPVIGPDGTSMPGHVYRLPDGGPFQIGPFDLVGNRDTPGTSNVPEPASGVLIGLACMAAGMARRMAGCPVKPC